MHQLTQAYGATDSSRDELDKTKKDKFARLKLHYEKCLSFHVLHLQEKYTISNNMAIISEIIPFHGHDRSP